MQHSLAKATDKMIRHVRRKNCVQIVKRRRCNARKLVGGSTLRPAAADFQPVLTLLLHTCLRSPKSDPGVLGVTPGSRARSAELGD